MNCPLCRHENTRVLETRLSQDGTSVRRRRECEACDYRFSTFEGIELLDLRVVKRDGSREMYDRDKLERGLRRALQKRSHTEDEFHGLINAIERSLMELKSNEVRSSDIGSAVMQNLRNFDQVAYIRFASVYRSFNDVQTFQDEISRLDSDQANDLKKK